MEELIDTWDKYEPSSRDFLDARYFYKILNPYAGLIIDSITDSKYPEILNIYRHIIDTEDSRYSILLIIDHTDKIIYNFDPRAMSTNSIPLNYEVQNLELPFHMYVDYGYTIAYLILVGIYIALDKDLSELKSLKFEPRKFATAIRHIYGSLSDEDYDIEY
jgi:hypothetical protein